LTIQAGRIILEI